MLKNLLQIIENSNGNDIAISNGFNKFELARI